MAKLETKEKRKIYRVVNEGGDYQQVLPETSAEQVKLAPGAGVKASNVQDAFKEIIDISNTTAGAVKSVNGKTGIVTLNATIPEDGLHALPDTTKYGATLDLGYAQDTGIVTATLKDQKGNTLSTKTIDLPLEMIVKSGTVETCKQANVPVSGYKVGDIYIDLVLAKTSEHIYILASELIDQVSIPEATGSGNVVSSITAKGNTITVTKGITAVTSVNGHTGASVDITAADLKLDKVSNTPDSEKEVLSATKLKTARNIAITGDATGNADFDGSKPISISVALSNKVTAANGKSVFNVDATGRITDTGTLIEFGTTESNTPTADLAVGGLFFELVQ